MNRFKPKIRRLLIIRRRKFLFGRIWAILSWSSWDWEKKFCCWEDLKLLGLFFACCLFGNVPFSKCFHVSSLIASPSLTSSGHFSPYSLLILWKRLQREDKRMDLPSTPQTLTFHALIVIFLPSSHNRPVKFGAGEEFLLQTGRI